MQYVDHNIWPAFFTSIRRELVDTVDLLLEHGADPNAVAKDDVMPLTLAMQGPESPTKNMIVKALQSR